MRFSTSILLAVVAVAALGANGCKHHSDNGRSSPGVERQHMATSSDPRNPQRTPPSSQASSQVPSQATSQSTSPSTSSNSGAVTWPTLSSAHGHASAVWRLDNDGDNDDGYLVVGSQTNFATAATQPEPATTAANPVIADSDRYAAWVLKLADSGEIVWQRQYPAQRESHGRAVAATGQSGFVIAGSHRDSARRAFHGMLLGIDANGDERWRQVLGDPGVTTLYAVVVAPDGTIYAAGQNAGRGWIVAADDDGTPIGQTLFPEFDAVRALAITADADGTITLLAGATQGATTTSLGTSELLGLDTEGKVRWRTPLPQSGKGEIAAIAMTKDGGGVAVGRGHGADNKKISLWLARWRGDGEVIASEVVPSDDIEAGTAVVALDDGGFAVAGHTLQGFRHRRVRVWRWDRQNRLQWAHSYGDSNRDLANGLARGPEGTLVAVGQTAMPQAGGSGLMAIAIDGDGTVQWQRMQGRE